MNTEPELLNERLERLAIVLDETMPNCALLVRDALVLLKEHDNEKKRIMKVIWNTLHEGLSIDTVADQDWVFERIRHQIEDT